MHFYVSIYLISDFCFFTAEIQGSVWKKQGSHQHSSWRSRDSCRQGSLQEHQQCESALIRASVKLNCKSASHYASHYLWLPPFSLTTRRSMRPPRTNGSGLWTDPDFVHNAKNSFQQSDVRATQFYTTVSVIEKKIHIMNWFVCNSQVEYKYDKEMMKGCVMSVTDDKNTILAKQNSELASNVSNNSIIPFLRINIQNVTI